MLRTILRNLLKPLSFLPALLMMYLIFSFSSQDGVTSAQLSYKVSYKIVEVAGEILDADFEPWEIESLANRFHGPIRKIAHMTEYFALAVSVAFPLYVYGLRGFLLLIIAGLFCVGFACADEYHQALVSGRNASKKDVAIDSVGIFAGIIFTRIIGWTGRKTIFRPLSKKKKEKNRQPDSDYSNYPNQPNLSYQNQQNPGYPYQPNPYYQNQPNLNYQNRPNPNYQNQQNPNHQNPSGINYQSGSGYGYYNQSGSGYSRQPYPASAGQHGPSYYGPPPYDFPVQNSQPMQDNTSDQLSEDMSFKKLMHDIKDKKQTERYLSRKPRLAKEDWNAADEFYQNSPDEPEITEIDLND